MLWQETNKEASKCVCEKSVNQVLWTISNLDFPQGPRSFYGTMADPDHGTGPASEGLMAQLILVPAP